MNVVSPLEQIRQGMRVIDGAGAIVGNVRDISGRAVLIIEAGTSRVFWVEDERIARVEGGQVHLTGA
jgi:hypothetical protein